MTRFHKEATPLAWTVLKSPVMLLEAIPSNEVWLAAEASCWQVWRLASVVVRSAIRQFVIFGTLMPSNEPISESLSNPLVTELRNSVEIQIEFKWNLLRIMWSYCELWFSVESSWAVAPPYSSSFTSIFHEQVQISFQCNKLNHRSVSLQNRGDFSSFASLLPNSQKLQLFLSYPLVY